MRSLLLFSVLLALTNAQQSPPAILVYHRTLDYFHESIPTAISALTSLASTIYTPFFTEDPLAFRSEPLANYAAVVFLSNSQALGPTAEQILDTEGQQALNDWLGKGGALIGLHSGCAVQFNEPSFGVAMGSWFDYHPEISNVTFVKTMSHPTTDSLPDRYDTFEETYNFLTSPTSVNVTVLLSPDASTYSDPDYATKGHFQGSPHPSAWYRAEMVDLSNGTGSGAGTMRGRLWYTSLGHTDETWGRSDFLGHVQAGLRWALEGENNTLLNSTSTANATSSASSASAITSASSAASRPSSASASSGAAAPSSAPSSGTCLIAPAFSSLFLGILALFLL